MKSSTVATVNMPVIQQRSEPKILTGWVPVVKIFTTKNRAVRLLWMLFTICMVVALVSSISVVVLRYLTYVTVVRLDQRGPSDDIPPPALTICLAEHNLKRDVYPRTSISPSWNIEPGVIKRYTESNVVKWHSGTDAVSKVYSYGGHFNVSLSTVPAGIYSLSVTEQLPRPSNSICTTFELLPTFPENSTYWKVFKIELQLAETHRTFVGRPLLIVHEPNSFPLDNFGRYLYEYVSPGTKLILFYSKSVTVRLNHRGQQCGSRKIKLLNYYYDYDQITCQWLKMCEQYRSICKCLCPLDILRAHANQSESNRCPLHCQHHHPVALINSTVCPLACQAVVYKKLNEVFDHLSDRNTVELQLVQAEGLSEMTEEELYSLPKLFSEIGGLSSFCFGFSCILFFELIELAIRVRCQKGPMNQLRKRLIDRICSRKHSTDTALRHTDRTQFSFNCITANTKHIAMDPIKICKVDGERLMEYPRDQDSPILGLRTPKRTLDVENKNSSETHDNSSHMTVQVIIGTERFSVPYEIQYQRNAT